MHYEVLCIIRSDFECERPFCSREEPCIMRLCIMRMLTVYYWWWVHVVCISSSANSILTDCLLWATAWVRPGRARPRPNELGLASKFWRPFLSGQAGPEKHYGWHGCRRLSWIEPHPTRFGIQIKSACGIIPSEWPVREKQSMWAVRTVFDSVTPRERTTAKGHRYVAKV